jgi:hypothetical protein
MVRTGKRTVNVKGIDLEVEYEYEPFDSREYEQTGYRGGIEVFSVKLDGVDVTDLLANKVSLELIEEETLEKIEDEDYE